MSDTITYRVEGMTCGGCAGALERALRARAPDLDVHVDFVGDGLTVSTPHDPALLQTLTEGVGFTWRGVSSS